MFWPKSATNSPWLAVIAGGLLAGLLGLLVFQMSRSIEAAVSMRSAESFLQILRQTQSYYSNRIVDPARKNGMNLHADLVGHPGSIPYPATFMHGLVRDLSARKKTYDFRFFSPLPFVQRPDSGPKDDFEWQAWANFSSDPALQSYTQTNVENGGRILRFALPVRMGEGCVACHNSHAESPHKFWNIGDLRGVQAITMPVVMANGFGMAQAHKSLVGLSILIFMLIGAVTAGWIVLLKNNRKLTKARQEIELLACTDLTTELGNRRQFFGDIDHALERMALAGPDAELQESQLGFAIILFDLCRFKVINDVHGQAVGDAVLGHVGRVLRSSVGCGDVVCRLGADEFGVLLRSGQHTKDIERMRDRILAAFGKPYEIEGKRLLVETHAGLASFPEDGMSRSDLMAAANLALQKAKIKKPGAFEVFRRDMRDQMIRDDQIARELKHAIERDELCLHYQPQYEASTSRLLGFEALIRWRHPEHGLLLPADFLPIAESRAMMLDIGEYVVAEMVETTLRWSQARLPRIKLAINLHHDQLQDHEHLSRIDGILNRTNWHPSRLTFEITEGCMIDPHGQEIDRLAAWRRDGYGVALDDFGTGYASLVHIRDLPVDEIKIDRTFAQNVESSNNNFAIVEALTKLATSLGMRVVAEGIESANQAEIFKQLGCQLLQGFHLGKPISEEDAIALMNLEFGQQHHPADEAPRRQQRVRASDSVQTIADHQADPVDKAPI